jgi:hypothetical protein
MQKEIEYLHQLDAAIARLSERIEQIEQIEQMRERESGSADMGCVRLVSQRLSALHIYRRALEFDRELTLRQIDYR